MIAIARSHKKEHEITVISSDGNRTVIPIFDESWLNKANKQATPENQTNRAQLAIKKIYDSLRTMAYNLFG